MTTRRVGCSLPFLLPLLAFLPNLLLLLLRILLLPCSSSGLTLDAIAPTTPQLDALTPTTTPDPKTTIPFQDDDWVRVRGDLDDDYDYNDDDYWLLNYTSCSSSDLSHDQSPRKDTVDFHDVRGQIVEHVLGRRGTLSDPEHLRLRARAAWEYQGMEWVVLKAPLVLTPRLGDDIPGEEVQESSEVNKDMELTLIEANINENRNVTELETAEQVENEMIADGSDGGDGDGESSVYDDGGIAGNTTLDDEGNLVHENDSESRNYSNTEGSVGVGNDIATNENETISKRISEEGSEEERGEQGEEIDVQERTGDTLVEEKEKEEIREVTVEEGARLRLVCNVTGVKHIWVEWRRAANLTFPGGSAVVGGRSVLFDFVGREDAGTYTCTARNPHGSTYSTAVTIHVQYVPVVGVWGRTMGGEGVELGCLGEGQPRPTLVWYKNNTKLPAACEGNTEVKSTPLSPGFVLSIIKISNATASDFALYHCRATNSLGISRSYLMLHDGSGAMSPDYLEQEEDPVIYSTPVENPRLASFLLGMVPPLYIALYIIAYLGCYKSPSTGGHGRFGANVDMDTE